MGLSVAQMWSFSKVFNPVRNLVARIPYIKVPLLCPECSSFWMGILTSFFYNPLVSCFPWIVATAFCGLLVHLFAVYLYKIYFKLS